MPGRYLARRAPGTRVPEAVDNVEPVPTEGKEPYGRVMADWGQRAKDKDRDEAIRLIEAAAARGAIIAADKEKRIQEVRSAQTVGEIELITRGLAAPVSAGASADPAPPAPGTPAGPTFETYDPPSTPPVAEPTPRPVAQNPTPPGTWRPDNHVQYGEPLAADIGTAYTPPVKRSGAGRLVTIVVLCVVAGIAVPAFFGIKGLVDGIDGIDGIVGGGSADVFSDQGLADLIEAVEEKSGSTEVFELSVFQGYAIVDIPTQSKGKRYISYRFDGRLSEFTKDRVSEDVRFDLEDVDAAVLRDLAAKARRMVEAPTSNYVIIRPAVPPFGNGDVEVIAYATNDFSESGYLEATLDGKVTARHPPS